MGFKRFSVTKKKKNMNNIILPYKNWLKKVLVGWPYLHGHVPQTFISNSIDHKYMLADCRFTLRGSMPTPSLKQYVLVVTNKKINWNFYH